MNQFLIGIILVLGLDFHIIYGMRMLILKANNAKLEIAIQHKKKQ